MDQISIFDYLDEVEPYHKCSDCVNAKYKETTSAGDPIWWCNIAHSYITIYTRDWLCRKKGNFFERRLKGDR